MNTILTIYSYSAFKRFLLPAINNANSSILVSGSLFNLPRDLEIRMEVLDQKWFFAESDEYELKYQNDSIYHSAALCSGDIIKLYLEGQHVLSMVARQTEEYFSVFSKYRLEEGMAPITIGSGSNNIISYSNLELISINHARVFVQNGQAYFEDLGSGNGSFVNNRRVDGSIPLSFGDCIDIYGLCIVYLGDHIAVNTIECRAKVDETLLQRYTAANGGASERRRYSVTSEFHRSPRHIARIDTDAVSIEEPPTPKELDQPTLFMTLAPTLTMALPMILGCALMIYASNTSGTGNGLYMYIGLITSVSSALIGSVWAVVNMKNARKKALADEAKRNKKYGEYLEKKEELIREKYQKNTNALYERYKAADECCSYSIGNPSLWNRNRNQEDFLQERVGIGDVPFQVEIKIPKEKFTMIEDELAERPAKIRSNYAMLRNVPFCVNLAEEKLIGIVGGRDKAGAVSISLELIAQLVANYSYTDVKIALVYDEMKMGLDGAWSFAKWLPHVWNETHTFRYVASNREEASEVFYELAQKMRIRIENAGTAGKQQTNAPVIPKPYYIVFLMNPELLEGEPVSKYIMDQDPICGMTALFLSETCEELPNECEYIIENDESFRGIYRMTDDPEDRAPVSFDPVSSPLLDQLARNVAGIEVHEVETGGDVPASLTFFDMYGINRLSELNVVERWKKNRTYDSMKALIGEKAGGAPCYLDVHEKYHGPHGLVAGTTGSGKSETLQTYILSLALNYSPDDIGFFIIDYKGGGMGNLFTDLPHMIGQISNLSGNQIRRALVSIKSEKDRRQRIFNENGVNNINSYTKLYKNNEAKLPVPHLFIVIDEFAEMKRDEPDFIQELVSVSQVGRSLGIHLIMATQKPAGTVDDNIWSNSKFKLCLRVQDRQDSMDMLHRADAAYIIQAGRCYLQVGNDELFELFQSGWSGAPYSEDIADMKTEVATMLAVDGVSAVEGSYAKAQRKREKKLAWIDGILAKLKDILAEGTGTLTEQIDTPHKRNLLLHELFERMQAAGIDYPENEYNANAVNYLFDLCVQYGMDAEEIIVHSDSTNRKLPEPAEITQLDAVVGYLKSQALANGYDHDFSLFLPLLPGRIHLEELPLTTLPFTDSAIYQNGLWPAHSEWTLGVSMGLFDDPENQRQDTFVLDPASAGHIAICGTIATGKSTFLQTMIYGLINRYSPEEVNLYLIDCSAKMLSAFENAPHVGGIMYDDDTEKIAKFFTLIRRILDQRKKLLSGGSFEQYVAVHGVGSLPAVFIVIDNYSGFLIKSGLSEENENFILQLSKEGVSYGIFFLVTAGGFRSGELPTRVADNFRTTVSLEMNDVMAYGEILRRMHIDTYPETDTKGRGIAVIEDRVLEFQTTLALDAESDYERGERIRQLCDEMRESWSGHLARRIPEIPEKPVWEDFLALDDTGEMLENSDRLPIGYDAEYADVYGIDLSRIYSYIISGTKHKGKTNVLKAIALSAQRKGGRVIVIDYSSGLERFCESAGIERISNEEELYRFLAGILPEFEDRNRRKHELMDQGLEEEEVYQAMQEFEKIYLLIEDLPTFVLTAYQPKNSETVGEYAELLESFLNFGAIHNIYWFSTLNKKEAGDAPAYRLYSLFLRDKKGLHLGGMTDDSPMNFDNLNYRERELVKPAGRAFLPVDNEETVTEVVIPLVKRSVG